MTRSRDSASRPGVVAVPPAPGPFALPSLAPAAGIPPEGSLEELDGTPILRSGVPSGDGAADAPASSPGRPAVPWWRAAGAATRLALRRPALWAYALVAFLARGGLLLLAGPIVVVPTLIGISNLVGPASVTAGGPAPRLVALLAAGTGTAAILIVAATVVAAAAEAALHRATVAPAAGVAARSPIAFRAALAPVGLGRGTIRVAAIRLVLLAPVLVVLVLAVPSWVAVAYRELTLPSDLATPLVARIVVGAPAASGAVAVAWLAGEVVGAFAARRAVLLDVGWPRALGSGLLDPLRAPVGAALTTAAALGLAAVTLGLGVAALAAAWDAVRGPLIDDGLTPGSAAGALLLVATWVAALALAGVAAAVRAALATAELLRHLPPPAPEPAR